MRVTLPSGTSAEVAFPDAAPARGVVVAPDLMGLRPLFDDMCTRLADEHGWAVCAVEPFPGREHLPQPERDIGSNPDERAIGDLVAAADHLGVEPVAVIGFCQGGAWAFKASASGRFDRAVGFYGMIRVPWARDGHGQPLDHLSRPGRCPVLAVVGGLDAFTPPADVEALAALPDVEIARYPEAEHGFAHDPGRPAHRADDAADAWVRAVAFLDR